MSKLQKKIVSLLYLWSPLSFRILRQKNSHESFSRYVKVQFRNISVGQSSKAQFNTTNFLLIEIFTFGNRVLKYFTPVFLHFHFYTSSFLSFLHTCFFAWVPLLTGGTLEAVGGLIDFDSSCSGALRSNLKLLLRYTALSLTKKL